jgi:hypothetical protein
MPQRDRQKELQTERPRRTSAANERATKRIGSLGRNDLNSHSRPPLIARGPHYRLYLEYWARQPLKTFLGNAHGPRSSKPLLRSPHPHGEQAEGKKRAMGAIQTRRLLRNRKKRCSQILQRKGTMPMLRKKKSNSLWCDLRMSGS